jgi:hypothetical protein
MTPLDPTPPVAAIRLDEDPCRTCPSRAACRLLAERAAGAEARSFAALAEAARRELRLS